MNEFEIGDVVELQCGSRSMTVTEVRFDGAVSVVWTDEQGRPQCMQAPHPCFFQTQK